MLQPRFILIAALILLGLGNFERYTAATLQQPEPQTAKPSPSRSDFSLRISTRDLITLSLKAEKAPLSNIAGEISKRLKIPVLLGKSVTTREVTTDFKGLTLEPAMHLLAPAVFIDYEINRAPGAQPEPVGIYLNGYDDAPPAINAVVPNSSQAILIEGNTEEGLEKPSAEEKDEPLRVVYERNALTVIAKKQALSVVLYKIANELGIPLEIKTDSAEIVDLDINKLPLEDAVMRLSPQVRLFVRADLQRLQRTPFRMVLVGPEKGS
ncbi:MAG: hypothetical protein ACREBG_06225 [Pyrinomonadaceae bacterium]